MTITAKKYEELTIESAVALARTHYPFAEGAALQCTEIGDGNLNYVFRVVDPESGKSVILKQALPYAKVVGESWPLTLQRAQIEADALRKHGEFVPNLVPAV